MALISMGFDPADPTIAALMQALTQAAKRGVVVTLAVDAYSLMMNSKTGLPTGPVFFHRDPLSWKSAYYRNKITLLEGLRAAGGEYVIINLPQTMFINPLAGRSHIKATVMGEEAYIGGCNLDTAKQVDLMVRIPHTKTADWIYNLIMDIMANGSTGSSLRYEDRKFVIDADTTLFVDSGKRKQSIIFKQALEFIDNAKEWLVMTCQYFPNSITAKHLAAAAKRGVDVKLFFNHPSQHGPTGTLPHHLVLLQERMKNPAKLFTLERPKGDRRIHAKLIATEQGAIIGSHNYVTAGILLGTAEAAILRRDPAFAKQALDVILPAFTQAKT